MTLRIRRNFQGNHAREIGAVNIQIVLIAVSMHLDSIYHHRSSSCWLKTCLRNQVNQINFFPIPPILNLKEIGLLLYNFVFKTIDINPVNRDRSQCHQIVRGSEQSMQKMQCKRYSNLQIPCFLFQIWWI